MSSTLTRDAVTRVARLARLALSDDEITLFTTQLGGILEYAEQIQAVDTTGVEPMSHATAADTMWREDAVAGSIERDIAMGLAPDADVDAGVFRVPKVIG